MKNRSFLFILFLIILVTACDKDDTITGDSALKIVNECEYSINIYFDDTLLGDVDIEGEETWSVPSGLHEVKATCQNTEAYVETHEFIDNQTIVLHLDIVITFKSKSAEVQQKILITNSNGNL